MPIVSRFCMIHMLRDM